jgi:hypothetical protein
MKISALSENITDLEFNTARNFAAYDMVKVGDGLGKLADDIQKAEEPTPDEKRKLSEKIARVPGDLNEIAGRLESAPVAVDQESWVKVAEEIANEIRGIGTELAPQFEAMAAKILS